MAIYKKYNALVQEPDHQEQVYHNQQKSYNPFVTIPAELVLRKSA